MILIIFLIMSIASPCFAGVYDYSDYEVGEFYPELGKVLWISEDKREIEYLPYVKEPEPKTELEILKEILMELRRR